jgi:hypothetical protein
MRQLKNDETLAKLPAPALLTPDQLVAVAAGTSALLAVGAGRIIIAGGIRPGPIYEMASATAY